MDIISKTQNIMFAENYYMYPDNFYIAVICNETPTRKVLTLNSCMVSIFPALEIKKQVLVGKIL